MRKVHYVSVNIRVETESEDRPQDSEIIKELRNRILDKETLDAVVETELCEDISE